MGEISSEELALHSKTNKQKMSFIASQDLLYSKGLKADGTQIVLAAWAIQLEKVLHCQDGHEKSKFHNQTLLRC
jgi:hypothetical protein